MGGIGSDWGYAVALDGNDNVCLTGQFTDQCDFDPNAGTANLTSLGENDIYVMKLSLPAVSSENELSPAEISLYPNPTTGILRINVSQATKLSIVNVLGQERATLEVQAQTVVDVSGFDAGIYFIRDLNSGTTVKFIKE